MGRGAVSEFGEFEIWRIPGGVKFAARKIAGNDCANRSMCGGIFSGTTLTRQHSYAGGAKESGVTAEQGDGDNGFARGAAFGLGGGSRFFSGRVVHHH